MYIVNWFWLQYRYIVGLGSHDRPQSLYYSRSIWLTNLPRRRWLSVHPARCNTLLIAHFLFFPPQAASYLWKVDTYVTVPKLSRRSHYWPHRTSSLEWTRSHNKFSQISPRSRTVDARKSKQLSLFQRTFSQSYDIMPFLLQRTARELTRKLSLYIQSKLVRCFSTGSVEDQPCDMMQLVDWKAWIAFPTEFHAYTTLWDSSNNDRVSSAAVRPTVRCRQLVSQSIILVGGSNNKCMWW